MDPIRVILLLMIKNESQIIKRSIDSTLGFADAICIEDTGSTDNTTTVVDEHFKTLTIPTKLSSHPWKNFGVSRSHSFETAAAFCQQLGWKLERTYVLAIDADMNLVIGANFKKEILVQPGYQITQINGTMEYINIRILRLDLPWKCVGATHEHWSAPPNTRIDVLDKQLIYIDDKNDGGCKSDKFQRDRDLLEEELKEQPENPRTVFYLAQTYKCLGDLKKSIQLYKKRIEIGGWFEEVWYSHYMIAQNYSRLNELEKAELWVQRAQKYKNYRAEALMMLVSALRTKPDQQFKAFHYLQQALKIKKPQVALFSEADTYDYKMDFEYTILQYYTNPNRKEGLMVSLKYLLKPGMPNTDVVFNNLGFYMEPIAKKRFALGAPDMDEYTASSPSTLTLADGSRLLNIRYVNYRINRSNGSYDIKDPKGHVRTQNAFLRFTGPLMPKTISEHPPILLTANQSGLTTKSDAYIFGFEDIRLFQHNNRIMCTASVAEFSPNIRIALGDYNIHSRTLENWKLLEPPTQTSCEKNWLAITHKKQLLFLYSYFPLQIGTLDKTNTFKTLITHKTPEFFNNLRGSANPVFYDGKLFVLVHFVKHSQPRHYFHQLLILDPETFKPQFLSNSFYFQELGVEYCIGFSIQENQAEFIYSHWDSSPQVTRISLDDFLFVPV